MTYSDHLYRLKDLLEDQGLTVDLFWEGPSEGEVGPGARIDYEAKWVGVNPRFSWPAKEALLSLAHEAGHWFSHCRNRDKDLDRQQRERLAYLYGWGVLQRLGVTLQEVTKADWRKAHEVEAERFLWW